MSLRRPKHESKLLDVVTQAALLALTLLLIACGSTTKDNSPQGGSPGAGGEGGAGANGGATPESCTQLGIELARDCTACPATALACECVRGFDVFPREACTFGQCLSAIDCDRVCKNLAMGPVGSEAGQDLDALRQCVATLQRCDSGDDQDCGDGKCVVDPLDGTGRCATGDVNALCKEPNDCQAGLFCVGAAVCTAGNSGDACDTSEQCQAGECVTFTRGPEDLVMAGQGVCTSGLPYEACTADEQCQASTHCVPPVVGRVLGACSPGSESDPCDDDGDCQSGFCIAAEDVQGLPQGYCTSGNRMAPCANGSDCSTGYCSRSQAPGANTGNCVTGDAGSLCANDDACAGEYCALRSSAGDGICTSGASGDPCHDDVECASATCVAPSVVDSATCNSQPPGSACENGGVCGPLRGTCFFGKCE